MARQASFASALRAALRDAKLRPADKAAVRLAERYADELDNEGDPVKVGPLLLATLSALGLTPAGRAAVLGKGVPNGSTPAASPLDQVKQQRERRLARQHNAADMDATAP